VKHDINTLKQSTASDLLAYRTVIAGLTKAGSQIERPRDAVEKTQSFMSEGVQDIRAAISGSTTVTITQYAEEIG
jgi:hypothetical protein